MTNFQAILTAAQQLPEQDRLRLIDALWDSVPADSDAPFTVEWQQEIERRLGEIDSGTATFVPWAQARDEALGRAQNGHRD